jgi:hypothetical protein
MLYVSEETSGMLASIPQACGCRTSSVSGLQLCAYLGNGGGWAGVAEAGLDGAAGVLLEGLLGELALQAVVIRGLYHEGLVVAIICRVPGGGPAAPSLLADECVGGHGAAVPAHLRREARQPVRTGTSEGAGAGY